ncbi:hypothetical protein Dimus_005898 [Dionaea muscipula]
MVAEKVDGDGGARDGERLDLDCGGWKGSSSRRVRLGGVAQAARRWVSAELGPELKCSRRLGWIRRGGHDVVLSPPRLRNPDGFNKHKGLIDFTQPTGEGCRNGGRRWVRVVVGGEGLVAAADEGGGEWSAPVGGGVPLSSSAVADPELVAVTPPRVAAALMVAEKVDGDGGARDGERPDPDRGGRKGSSSRRVRLGGVGGGRSTVGIGRARPGVEVLAAARAGSGVVVTMWCSPLPSRAIPVLYRWPTGRVAADSASRPNGLDGKKNEEDDVDRLALRPK